MKKDWIPSCVSIYNMIKYTYAVKWADSNIVYGVKGVFMRILVISDSHGNTRNIERAVESQPEANIIIHLGDGADDIVDLEFVYRDKQFYQVAGNCDWGSSLPLEGELKVADKTIFFVHGHEYRVKTNLQQIKMEARKRNADIVLFGHTHLPITEYDDELYLLNPGSLQYADGTYGIIDITDAGISVQIITV